MSKARTSNIRKVVTDNPAVDGDTMYVVDLYEDGKLVQVRDLPGKSRHYAQDVAENWETGVIQLLTE